MPKVTDCALIELPKRTDTRGSLTFIESDVQVPFAIRRVFYVYDVASEQRRGAHAHRELHQVLVCLAGGVDIALDDGESKRTVRLAQPWLGLHVPPLIWASEGNFGPGTVYMALCSELYDPADYYRDYDTFRIAAAAARAAEG